MQKIEKGDIVGRKSYGKDIIFIVYKIIELSDKSKIAILKGLTERIEADSNIEDLIIIPKEQIKENLHKLDIKVKQRAEEKKIIDENKQNIKKNNRASQKVVTGKILHLDGDRKYSEKSLKYYKKLGLNAIVKNIPENRQAGTVYKLLQCYKPDILVITGHDGMIKKSAGFNDIYNYRNSKHFIETVKEARRYDKESGNNLVIFAGACQSYFEALISAGANFASSPARILIDFLDPLVIAESIATTEDYKYITIEDIEKELRDGRRGISGIGGKR